MRAISTYIHLIAWAWFAYIPVYGQFLVDSYKFAAPAPAFTAQTAGFAASEYGRFTTAATGISDSFVGTCSFWYNPAGSDATDFLIFSIGDSTVSRLQIFRSNAGKIVVEGYTSGGTLRVNMVSTASVLAADTGMDGVDGWVKVFICWDQNNAANCKMYFNGATNDAPTVTVTNASAIDLAPTTPRYTIGGNASTSPSFRLNGSLSEFVFYDTYHDIPASFYSGTKPADIGATGSTPTGAAPDIYLSRNGSGNSWLTDSSGNGNTFTASGTLTSPTAP